MTYGMIEFLADIRDHKVDPGTAYEALSYVDRDRLEKAWRRLNQIRQLSAKGGSARVKEFRGRVSNHTGRVFERVVRVLLERCAALKLGTNVRSTISEIDFLIVYGPLASAIPMFREAGSHSLGEAKCVKGAMKTEWVNEMAGFMPVHGCSLGILFTAAPPKRLGSAARHAISLHAARGVRIVPFGPTQIDRVIQGENFLVVLSEQYVNVAALSTELHI